jgi:glycosyltransferase involved in cell wall biosynthesis
MRVGVNLCWLVPGLVGGSEEATIRALDALADLRPADVEPVLLGLDVLRRAHPRLVERFEAHTVPLGGSVKALRVLAEHSWLPVAVRRHDLDLIHDAGGTSPGRVGVPRVVTIHDIQPLEIPGNFGRARVAYLRRSVPRAVAGAARVLVPSEFVRRRLVEHLGADPDRIAVVPWSVPPQGTGTPIEVVRARYGIMGGIILVPGITYPHKDHVVAVRAMRHLVERHADTTMVLVGGAGPAEGEVEAEIARQGIGDRIVRTGRVPEAVVRSLLVHAEVVVVPSRYEGFGLPALEAMAAGTPVVVADAGASPEVVGSAGVVFPAGDDAHLALELHRILSEPERGRALVEAGTLRAADFDASRTGEALLAAYRSASAGL